ncbi:hypothetical protein LOD99_12452 [Oopsacas minuta]|uniref:Uncharacterized protein n=1 Tax=Oopsacas minuta TaxID=111878 RepID=A0AAV7JGA4_9METZ|nr:hypothetical protein LOD99_12452 [Oopsacas minuta]
MTSSCTPDIRKFSNVHIFTPFDTSGFREQEHPTERHLAEGHYAEDILPKGFHAENVISSTAIEEIKSRAILIDETTSSVINKCTESISIPAAVKLPSKESLSKIVRRKRKATELDIFDSVHTTRGHNFLILNNPELELIVLGTEDNIVVLISYKDWFCDGTFNSAPIGYQLYTIHALVSESATISLIFCIAKQKYEVPEDNERFRKSRYKC